MCPVISTDPCEAACLELFNLTFVFRFYWKVILIVCCLFRLYFDMLVVSYDSCSLV